MSEEVPSNRIDIQNRLYTINFALEAQEFAAQHGFNIQDTRSRMVEEELRDYKFVGIEKMVSGTESEKVQRGLLLPYERIYALDEDDLHRLPEFISDVREKFIGKKFPDGFIFPEIPFDIIIGDPTHPESCYRHHLVDYDPDSGEFTVRDQIKVEKEFIGDKYEYTNFAIRQQHGSPKDTQFNNIIKVKPAELGSVYLVFNDRRSLVEEQRQLKKLK